MRTIAFCLLTYRSDHPSGIERSIAALVEGVRRLGHKPLVLAAGPACESDATEPGMVRLESVRLPRPALNQDVVDALADPGPVVEEVRQVLARHRVDGVCWADTLWGLGYLNPAPDGVRSALMVHKIRPRAEERWQHALRTADVVCAASDFLSEEGAQAGLDTGRWATVPNALLDVPAPVPAAMRERLRQRGPIRIASRVEPAKGLVELLEAVPEDWQRPIELVLAEADFEFWTGMQRDVLAACRKEAALRPENVRLLPALGWREVPPFLAGAAATIISSTEPETFCHTAAEALSVGTPVVTFDLGNVPRLVGAAGRAVPLEDGAAALWSTLSDLLNNADDYAAASRSAPSRVAAFNPIAAATALLTALRL
jgi:glycosyltransferase involved in cell wall biosynthesis